MKNLLNLLILPLFAFCSFLQINNMKLGSSFRNERTIQDKNQIGYLFFKVQKSSSGVDKVILESKKIATGKLKSTPVFDRRTIGLGDFIVSLTDENGKELIKQNIDDPLNQNIESFDKEGISKHKVSLENAEFSIRYSYSSDIKIVRVEKVTNAGNQLLFTQKL